MSSALRALWARGQHPLTNVMIPTCSISTASHHQQKPVLSAEAAKAIGGESFNILRDGTNHKVDNLEKRLLVWAGKFKTVEDVTPTVPQGMMEKARNKVRIKISNYMMLATVIASLVYVYSGKQAAKRGETVQKMNLDWHRQINAKTTAPPF